MEAQNVKPVIRLLTTACIVTLASACATGKRPSGMTPLPGVARQSSSRMLVSPDGKDTSEATISYDFYKAPATAWQDSVNCSIFGFVNACISFEQRVPRCQKLSETVFESVLDTFVSRYKEEQDMHERSWLTWGFESASSISAPPGNYTGVRQSCYVFTGGAHPNTMYLNSMIRHQDGMTMKLEDVVTDLPGFNRIAEKYFKEEKEIPEDYDLSTDPSFWFPNGFFECNDNFVIDSLGFHFVFNAYEIAPYVFGPTHFTVPMEQVKGLLSPGLKL